MNGLIAGISDVTQLDRDLNDPDFMTYGPGPWAYRGQSKAYGTLLPAISRELNGIRADDTLHIESEQIVHFRRHYEKIWDIVMDTPSPDDIADPVSCLSTMQHYGVPTRLLDWTGDIWVALFFACSGNSDEDGELWIYSRSERFFRDAGDGCKGGGESFSPSVLFMPGRAYSPFLLEIDIDLTGRMRQQRGFHTVCNHPLVDHADLIGSHRRYGISKGFKPKALEYLDKIKNISARTLFPDIVGVRDYARWHLEFLKSTFQPV